MSYMIACGLVHVRQAVLIGMMHLVIFVLFQHRVWLAWSIFVHGRMVSMCPFSSGRACVESAQAAWIVMKLMST